MGSVLEILLTQALAYQAQGDTSAALLALDRALTLAEPEGYVRTFLNEGETMRQLLADSRALMEKQKRREGQQLIEYVESLLAAFGKPTDVQPSHRHFAQAKVPFSPQPLIEPLSPRELEVLRLIQQGLSNQEIADRLYLALSTVKGYTRTLFDKLQVQRRTEAVVRARELGLL
jgi:LuxR family maltose regulon positive regulatory protein